MNDLTTVFPITEEGTSAGRKEADFTRALLGVQGTAGWVAFPDVQQDKVQIVPVMTTTGISTAFSYITNEQTLDHILINREMALLEAVAKTGNTQVFIALIGSLTWQNRQADEYIQAIQLCLSVGAHQKARELGESGSQQYPENSELKNMAHVLGPSKVLNTRLPSDPGASADMNWLKQNRGKYQGRWVALKDGNLLADGASYDELVKIIGNPKGQKILITTVY